MSIRFLPLRTALCLGLLALAGLWARPAAAVGIGDPAPDFTGENLQESEPAFFQLSAYRGHVVVLEFFAYW